MTKRKHNETTPPDDDTYCTAAELADMFNFSVRYVRELRANGVLVTEKTPRGMRYKRTESLLGLARHLIAKQAEKSAKQRIDEAEADYKERKEELARLELAKRRKEVHEARHVKAYMQWIIDSAHAAFATLPDEVTPKLAACRSEAEIAEELKMAIHEKLRALSTAPVPAIDSEKGGEA